MQSLFWHFYWVWHGGGISEASVGDWGESIVWVCRECVDGGGRDCAGFGNASDMAFGADIDGFDMGAYLRIGDIGGGEVGGSGPRLNFDVDFWARVMCMAATSCSSREY